MTRFIVRFGVYSFLAFFLALTPPPTLAGGCPDVDGDAVCDDVDNCPLVSNPSQTDLDLAFYPEFHQLIVSLIDEKNTQVRLFRIVNGEVTKEELVTHHEESEDTGNGLKERVQEVLNEVRPSLQQDGGDVEFVDLGDDGVVKVRLTGACAGCPMSQMTLQMGIQRVLQEKIPEVTGVEGV